MTFKEKYKMREDLIKVGTKRRSGIKNLGVKFGVLHDTGNPNSTAQNNVNYYKNSANSSEVSAHVFVDDKDIIICVPLNEKAWHVLYNVTTDNEIYGDDANDIAIGIELCFFPNDKARTLEAYKKFVWFSAWLAHKYNMNPKNSFIGHHILDPKRKVDPKTALKVIGKTYEDLLNDIVKEYDECVGNSKPIEEEKEVTIFKPTSKSIQDSTVRVLKNLEQGEKGLAEKWRLDLLNGKLELSDAIGLVFVAIDRGLLDMKKEDLEKLIQATLKK